MERVAYAKARAAQQKEYLQGVRRKFFKSVKPQVEREQQQISASRKPAAGAVQAQRDHSNKRKREDSDDSKFTERASATQGSQSDRRPPSGTTRPEGKKARVDIKSLPKGISRDKKKAKKVARLLEHPNRFTPALKQAITAAQQRDTERAEADRQRQEADKRASERRKMSKLYAKRTKSGQPVMAHRAKDLLRKVERITGGPIGGK